jgi:hypothetical protein
LRSLAQGRLVLLLTVSTIALALPPAFALRPSLQEVFAGTLAGDHVLRNHPDFAPLDVMELLHEKRAAFAGARQSALAAGFLAILLQVYFAGGFVETLVRGRAVLLADFFSAASRNLWHNLKCFGIFLGALVLALAGWLGSTAALGRPLFESSAPGSPRALLFHIGTWVVALLIFAMLSLLHDFARLARRQEPRIGAWRGWRAAVRVLAGSIFPALGLFLFWLLAGGILWIGILSLEWGTPAVSIAAILLHTAMQVAAVAVRSAVRVGAWGSYAALLDARLAAPTPIAEPETGTTPPDVSIVEPIPPLDSLGTNPT